MCHLLSYSKLRIEAECQGQAMNPKITWRLAWTKLRNNLQTDFCERSEYTRKQYILSMDSSMSLCRAVKDISHISATKQPIMHRGVLPGQVIV